MATTSTFVLKCIVILLVFVLQQEGVASFSNRKSPKEANPNDLLVSRQDFWKTTLGIAGGLAYGKLVAVALSNITRGTVYPKSHEDRVENAIARALVESATYLPRKRKVVRVLEVGMGDECRVIRRGLYRKGLDQLSFTNVHDVHWTGVDLKSPSEQVMRQVKESLVPSADHINMNVNVVAADVTKALPYPNGYFDVILSCLTLCSVSNQSAALDEIKRLLRPDGGTFAYVEHVAVNPDEPYRVLEWQQQTFDPLQQILADNCHLHRNTEESISTAFGLGSKAASTVCLQHERFLVQDMWPVSCQCSGVLQRRD